MFIGDGVTIPFERILTHFHGVLDARTCHVKQKHHPHEQYGLHQQSLVLPLLRITFRIPKHNRRIPLIDKMRSRHQDLHFIWNGCCRLPLPRILLLNWNG